MKKNLLFYTIVLFLFATRDYIATNFPMNEDQAQNICPKICATHGGWNGYHSWYRYFKPNSYCGCNIAMNNNG